MEAATVQIPALTAIIMTSRTLGYPAVSKKDILPFIQENPIIYVEVPCKESVKTDTINETKLGIFDDNSMPLFDAIKSNKFSINIEDNKKAESIYNTISERFIDFDSDDVEKAIIVATGLDFGIISCVNYNSCDLDTYISNEEVLYMVAKTKYRNEVNGDSIDSIFGNSKYSSIIANIKNIDFYLDIDSNSYRKPANLINTLYYTIKVLRENEYNNVTLDVLQSSIGDYNYNTLLSDYGSDRLKALYIADKIGLLKNNKRALDDEITRYEALKIVIGTIS